jgi:hypothetical protein
VTGFGARTSDIAQDIDGSGFLDNGRDEPTPGRSVGNVELVNAGESACLIDGSGRDFGPGHVHIGKPDMYALLGQHHRNCLAHSGCRTSDDRHLVR